MVLKESFAGPLEKMTEYTWRIPKSYLAGMRVDGIIYSDEKMLRKLVADMAPQQVANVATLPGIVRASYAMPDIHWGYGFCIGGVCATDPTAGGVISPGGVGYDINCGVRLLRSNLVEDDVRPKLKELMFKLFKRIPAGVGKEGRYSFRDNDMDRLLADGAPFLVERGLGTPRDIAYTEAGGCLPDAKPEYVSQRARTRGAEQCGTLGSGNHFAEVQVVDHVFDESAADAMGIFRGQVCVMIHSGSRGLGYQVCDDALLWFRGVPEKYGIELPDRQLACAPVASPEGQRYLGAMRAAANYAWCNRQLLMVQIREAFAEHFGADWQKLDMELVYDVAHNIAKFENHHVNGEQKEVCVHRKGATRAFPAGHPELPDAYRALGQPVLIPGDMGTASFVLLGQPGSMEQTFGTTCHGAGRALSRTASVKQAAGRDIARELESRGIVAMAHSRRGLAEEQPMAYKDVNNVVNVVHEAGLSKKVARLRPIGVVKG